MAVADLRTLEEYLELPYRIAVTRDDDSADWVARAEELPGCEARGVTVAEAAAAIRPAMQVWVRDALAEGREVPEPRQRTHSGRLLVRMPPSLHAELAQAADREGVSLNQLITGALAGAIGWRDGRAPVGAPERAAGARRLLVANLVVLALTAAAAVTLLVFAWRHGF